jgi:hypothetical protein
MVKRDAETGDADYKFPILLGDQYNSHGLLYDYASWQRRAFEGADPYGRRLLEDFLQHRTVWNRCIIELEILV